MNDTDQKTAYDLRALDHSHEDMVERWADRVVKAGTGVVSAVIVVMSWWVLRPKRDKRRGR